MRRARHRGFGGLAFGLALMLGAPMAPGAAEAHGWRHHRRHHHHHHGTWYPRIVYGVAPPYWPYWGWGAPPPVVVYPPRGVVEEPEIYIERSDPPTAGYWYYCEPAGAYYPDVPSCEAPWVKVPPRPE